MCLIFAHTVFLLCRANFYGQLYVKLLSVLIYTVAGGGGVPESLLAT